MMRSRRLADSRLRSPTSVMVIAVMLSSTRSSARAASHSPNGGCAAITLPSRRKPRPAFDNPPPVLYIRPAPAAATGRALAHLDARRHPLEPVRARPGRSRARCASSRRRAWSSRTAPTTRSICATSLPTIPRSRRGAALGRGGDPARRRRSAAGRASPIPASTTPPPAPASPRGSACRSTASRSVRGSRAGELVARCIVETGTSSYYAALGEAAARAGAASDLPAHRRRRDPPLQALLHAISSAISRASGWASGAGCASRSAASPNRRTTSSPSPITRRTSRALPYDRAPRGARLCAARLCASMRRHHVERGIAMVFKAVGLKPNGRLNRVATGLAWWSLRRRAPAAGAPRPPDPRSIEGREFLQHRLVELRA